MEIAFSGLKTLNPFHRVATTHEEKKALERKGLKPVEPQNLRSELATYYTMMNLR